MSSILAPKLNELSILAAASHFGMIETESGFLRESAKSDVNRLVQSQGLPGSAPAPPPHVQDLSESLMILYTVSWIFSAVSPT